jgi:antitoxin ParD1/3/4
VSRNATLNVSLTPQQLRLVRQRVNSGRYESASEVIRESLRMLFQGSRAARQPSVAQIQRAMANGYQAMETRDRRLAHDWSSLPEAWPER